jgi:UDP-glucose 4-epimerase
LAPINPYGHTKHMAERILDDYGKAYGLSWVALRYFNAAGADLDGEIGADHRLAKSLVPRVLEAGLGTGPALNVFGRNYDTPDGTAVRDFIHVADLAAAHVAALEYLQFGGISGPFNLGTGQGHSVQEVIVTASRVLGVTVPTTDCPRRPGDLAFMVANSDKAMTRLNWRPSHSSLDEIIASAVAWQRRRTAAAE